jgi:outer membrane protein TolC
LSEATAAVALMPRSVRAQLAMPEALAANGNTAQARFEFERALKQAAETGNAWYPNQIAEAERGLAALTSKEASAAQSPGPHPVDRTDHISTALVICGA